MVGTRRQDHLLNRGFTLIEVLFALAVLGIALIALISSMATYARTAGALREKTLATMVAHNRLTQIELEAGWPDVGKSDGDVEMAGIKWRWNVEIKKTPDDHLRRVDISVHRDSDRDDDSSEGLVSLSAFLADTGRQ